MAIEPTRQMAEPLQGIELRVFRSLLHRSDRHNLKAIRVELIGKPEPVASEVETALSRLVESGYLEEFEPGRWRLTRQGYSLRLALLGESSAG
jgi:DNA-binding IclR family transcriptional regulator